MEIGIIGLPSVGKTTLFNIVTKNFVKTGGFSASDAPNIGVATVPDKRMAWLSSSFNPKKTTYATINFVDVAGLVEGANKKDSFSGKFMSQLRAVDALVHVVRIFDDPAVPHPSESINPVRDISTVETELLLGDMGVVEKRMERLQQDISKGRNRAEAEKEMPVLLRIQERLENEQPLRGMEFSEEEERMIRGYTFLSGKPMIYAINLGEGQEFSPEMLPGLDVQESDGMLLVNGTPAIAFQGKVEEEIAQLPDEEVDDFLGAMGIDEPAAHRLIRTCYHALNVISFFTVGEDECRAWTTTRGDSAPVAAGRIHSDLERGFIRAEVYTYDDLRRLGTVQAIKEAGLFRLEGKTHIVQDGEVLNIRFNV
ncbi:MAG TPA: redox-regulated ATPase YchF [Armatimonadota bacterium]|nr:redox-regulated ATPase YchF [Armatimonadota bacterium]